MVSSYAKYGATIKGGLLKVVQKAADGIVADVIDNMKARKTGEQYSTLPNRSSAKGETPAYQSGNLAQSIKVSVKPIPLGAEAEIRVTAEYAKYLAKDRPILSFGAAKYKSQVRNGVIILMRKAGGV